jgi:hypothetical protein
LARGHHDGQDERRRDVRIAPKGTVLVRAGTYVLRGRIANVSLGGLLATTRVTAPERLLGVRVAIELRLDGGDHGWFELGGRLQRIGANSLAVTFDTVAPAFVRTLEELRTVSYERRRILSLVLVDTNGERRAALASGFRASHCTVIDAATPLEAIVRLGESRFEPDVIAIADSSPATIADELRRFVDTEHPRARVLTIGHELVGPGGGARWLSSADSGDDLVTRIRQLLITATQ